MAEPVELSNLVRYGGLAASVARHVPPGGRSSEQISVLRHAVPEIPDRLLGNWSEEVVADFLQKLEYRTVPANASIFQEGSDATHLYVVASGAVKVVHDSRCLTTQSPEAGSEEDPGGRDVDQEDDLGESGPPQEERPSLNYARSTSSPSGHCGQKEADADVGTGEGQRSGIQTMRDGVNRAILLTKITRAFGRQVSQVSCADIEDVVSEMSKQVSCEIAKDPSMQSAADAQADSVIDEEAARCIAAAMEAEQFCHSARLALPLKDLMGALAVKHKYTRTSKANAVPFATVLSEFEERVETTIQDSIGPVARSFRRQVSEDTVPSYGCGDCVSPRKAEITHLNPEAKLLAKRCTEAVENEEPQTSFHGPGSVLGVKACLAESVYDCSSTAVEDCELLCLSTAELKELVELDRVQQRLQREALVAKAFSNSLRKVERDKIERLTDCFRVSVHRRGTVLCWEGERRETSSQNGRLLVIAEGRARLVKAFHDSSQLQISAAAQPPPSAYVGRPRDGTGGSDTSRDVGMLPSGYTVNGASVLLGSVEPFTVIVESAEATILSASLGELIRSVGMGVVETLQAATEELNGYRIRRLDDLEDAVGQQAALLRRGDATDVAGERKPARQDVALEPLTLRACGWDKHDERNIAKEIVAWQRGSRRIPAPRPAVVAGTIQSASTPNAQAVSPTAKPHRPTTSALPPLTSRAATPPMNQSGGALHGNRPATSASGVPGLAPVVPTPGAVLAGSMGGAASHIDKERWTPLRSEQGPPRPRCLQKGSFPSRPPPGCEGCCYGADGEAEVAKSKPAVAIATEKRRSIEQARVPPRSPAQGNGGVTMAKLATQDSFGLAPPQGFVLQKTSEGLAGGNAECQKSRARSPSVADSIWLAEPTGWEARRVDSLCSTSLFESTLLPIDLDTSGLDQRTMDALTVDDDGRLLMPKFWITERVAQLRKREQVAEAASRWHLRCLEMRGDKGLVVPMRQIDPLSIAGLVSTPQTSRSMTSSGTSRVATCSASRETSLMESSRTLPPSSSRQRCTGICGSIDAAGSPAPQAEQEDLRPATAPAAPASGSARRKGQAGHLNAAAPTGTCRGTKPQAQRPLVPADRRRSSARSERQSLSVDMMNAEVLGCGRRGLGSDGCGLGFDGSEDLAPLQLGPEPQTEWAPYLPRQAELDELGAALALVEGLQVPDDDPAAFMSTSIGDTSTMVDEFSIWDQVCSVMTGCDLTEDSLCFPSTSLSLGAGHDGALLAQSSTSTSGPSRRRLIQETKLRSSTPASMTSHTAIRRGTPTPRRASPKEKLVPELSLHVRSINRFLDLGPRGNGGGNAKSATRSADGSSPTMTPAGNMTSVLPSISQAAAS